jgi:hypothetical protein
VSGAVHAPAQRRLQRDGQQRRLVTPVLEEAPGRVVRAAVEQRGVVRPGAAEQRQVVSTLEHVHRIDLDQADAIDQPPQGPAVGRSMRPRVGEPLRGERHPAGLGGGEALDRAAGGRHGRRIVPGATG